MTVVKKGEKYPERPNRLPITFPRAKQLSSFFALLHRCLLVPKIATFALATQILPIPLPRNAT